MAWIQAITDGPGLPSVRNWEKNESLNEPANVDSTISRISRNGIKGPGLG